MSRDPSVLCEKLSAHLTEILSAAPPQLTLRVISTERTADEQHALYQRGRTDGSGRIVTYKDGYVQKSPHQKQMAHGENAVHACDFGVFTIGGTYLTGAHYYAPLVAKARELGLFSGASWKFQDLPHVQCLEHLT